jgi:hypothetical protein
VRKKNPLASTVVLLLFFTASVATTSTGLLQETQTLNPTYISFQFGLAAKIGVE